MLPLPAPRHETVWLCCGGTYIRVARTNIAPGATFPVLEKALFWTQRCSLSSSPAFHSFFPSLSKTGWFHIVLCAVPTVPHPCHSPWQHALHSCSARGKRRTLHARSSQHRTAVLWGSFVTGKGALIPWANSTVLSWARNAALSLGCPAQWGTSRAVSKGYKHTAFPDSLSTPRQRGSSEEREHVQNKEMRSGRNYKIPI